MATKQSFDPKSFLAHVGEGRSIARFHKHQILFSQGDPADAVSYIQKGKVKVTVVSEQGKEAVVANIEPTRFVVMDVSNGRQGSPIPLPRVGMSLAWHARHQDYPRHAWLCWMIVAVVADVGRH